MTDNTIRDIASRLELFVDDWLIDRMDGVRLQMHHPIAREIVFPFDAPWEGPLSFYPTVLTVDDEYRLYYRGEMSDELDAAVTAVATSHDGISWQRPSLHLHEWNGTRNNNIIGTGQATHNFAPFVDTNPAEPHDRRFKAVASSGSKQNRYLRGFVSADGYRWHELQETPIPIDGAFDSQNIIFWDAYRRRYVAFYRDFRDAEGNVQRWNGIRSIKWATSPDFTSWTNGQWLDFGDTTLEHLYTNATISYFRAPHIYLAFPKRFVPHRAPIPQHPENGLSDGVFMSSRDGLHWDRRFLEAFVRPGRDPLNWTDRNNAIAWGILATAHDELSIYWVENYRHASCRLRRGTLRMDGFVSLHADYTGGEVITRPLRFEGNELNLNFATSAVGSIRVEIQDQAGRPIEGYRLQDSDDTYGDEINGVYRWHAGTDVSKLANDPVRLRIVLRDADLYSLRFRLSGQQ